MKKYYINKILNKFFLFVKIINNINIKSYRNRSQCSTHQDSITISKQSHFISDIREIHSNLELEKVLESILKLCIEITCAKHSYFLLNKNDRLILAAEIYKANNDADPIFEYHSDDHEYKSPSESHHALIEEILSQKDVKSKTETTFYLPILFSDEISGILFIEDVQSWVDLSIDRIKNLSNHISASINNAILYSKMINKKEQLDNELIERNELILHAGRLSAIGELSKGIINEINQALSIIRLTSDEFSMYFENKEQDAMTIRSIKKIKPETDRAAMILNELSQYTSSEQSLTKDLEAIVQTSIRYFKHQLKTNNILLTFDSQEDLPEIPMDSKKIVQIIVNLFSNAVHSMNQKAKKMDHTFHKEMCVKLYEDKKNERIILKIEDNGLGMNNEQLQKCMEPFYTTKEKDEGTGLGLFIVRRLLSQLSMKIEVDSVYGESCCFTIFIPVNG